MKKKDDELPELPEYAYAFPSDDEASLEELTDGEKNLNIFYAHQYVQDEEVVNEQAGTVCTYRLKKPNVLNGSVVGAVYHENNKVQTFLPAGKGFAFTSFPYNGPKVVDAKMENKKGILTLTWDRKIKAGSSKVIVSYEYDAA